MVINTLFLVIYLSKAEFALFFNYCPSKNSPTILNQAVQCVQIVYMYIFPLPIIKIVAAH